MSAPPIRCVDCARVRYGGPGSDWHDHPGKLPGEVAVICSTCNETRKKRARRDYYAGVRRTVRRQQHREPWAEGTTPADVWKGFREGDR